MKKVPSQSHFSILWPDASGLLEIEHKIDETTFEQIVVPTDNITRTVFKCHFTDAALMIDASTMTTGKSTPSTVLTAKVID